ncbi:AAA family ATPase [Salisediminibacterium selenitireducens]|uniref:Nuclease SbcCD subunit C n=1 Tax=Bacillus selenitireducens (strain ATCC 700615 / DSM 15326 / MLS10) TaxID=439292 RepID=D6XUJ9_BACIE|nr:SMC family ATPase [Salisediminibacterium selenitireducens]ADH99485.1 SMC domain protein [[Bacillus] selenitireducens MLS10]
MKPIELSLKGIHSFKETQTIDFEELTEAGLFGIFGPTGAGKSTILDAITLALYGKVERAPVNKEGIINHASDEMYTAFIFTLGTGNHQTSYKAERSFKLQKNGSVKQTVSRLIKGVNSPVTLADKASDMDKSVIKLLGLELDDFTRAVVLPQGKFSEFLTLKGTERRKMLQRLFHLEKYGDRLNAKLKHKLDDTAHQLAVIKSEQAGLGDASKTMISDQKKEFENLKKEQIMKKEQFSKNSDELKKVERWDELSIKLKAVQSELYQFEQDAAEMAHEEARLNQAETALNGQERARTILDLHRDIEALQQDIQTQLKQKDVVHNEYIEAKKTKDSSDKQMQSEKPILEKQYDEADQAIRLIGDRKELTDKHTKLQNEEKELQFSIEQLNNTLRHHQHDLARYEKEVQKLKKDLETYTISEEDKRLVNQTEHIISQKKDLNNRIITLNKNLLDITEKQKETKKQTEQIEKEKELCQNKLHDQYGKLQFWYDAFSSYKRTLESAKLIITDNRNRRQKHHQESLLAEIRDRLNPDEPCPLCGSVHHEVNHLEAFENADEHIPSLDTFVGEVDRLTDEVNTHRIKLESTAENIPLSPENTSIESGDEVKVPDLYANDFEEGLRRLKQTMHASAQTIGKLYSDVHETLSQLRHHQDQLMTSKERLSGIEEQKKQLIMEHSRTDGEMKETEIEWRKHTASIPFKQAEAVVQSLKEKKELYHRILGRLENARPAIEKKNALINQSNEELYKLQVKKTAAETKLAFQLEQIETIDKSVQSLTDGEQPEDIKKRVSEKILYLKERFEKADQDVQQKEKDLQRISNELIRLESNLESKNSFLNEQEQSFHNWLDETSFKDAKDVLEHTVPKAELEKQKERLNERKEAYKNSQESYRTIKNEMDNLQLTEAAREEIRQESRRLEKEMEDLYDRVGRKKQEIESLVKRAERYDVLEKERMTVVSLLEDLEKLQIVFRGKQFVEFIAEEQLIQVSRLASERLYELTKGKFAIEIDSDGGFVIRDDANGGIRRPVSSLSGGETFITSLALALALSMTIQLKGQHPLEFFFLDEGFGTLDEHLLETVIGALERLQTSDLSVGIISHVKELRERIPRKLLVTSSVPGGAGSKVTIEHL